MNWNALDHITQLDVINEESKSMPILLFKHSTRCAVSSMAKSRLERSKTPEKVDFYFLDLIKYRSVSNKIETEFMVNHESPQVLLIKNGECVYEESHSGISMDEIEEQVKK